MMLESATPLLVETTGYVNVTDLLKKRLENSPQLAAFERPRITADTTTWHEITVAQFEQQVMAVAKGLVANGVGIGGNVVIMAQTQYEWAVAEMAIWYAGGVVVPIYDTSSVAQSAAILQDANARVAFAGNARQADILREASHTIGKELSVYSLENEFVELIDAGDFLPDAEIETRRLVANQADVATIVYTSGTTGEPKGALITHQNLLGQVLNIGATYTDVIWEGGRTIIFLPLAHVLARGLQLVCLANGMKIAHLADPKQVVPALGVLKPTFLVVVPRVLQKIQAAAGLAARKKRIGPIWDRAVNTAITRARHLEEGTTPRFALRASHAIFDRIFFARLRALMGGEIGYLLSGAAALEADLALFYRGIGVPVVEGYGLTETTAPVTGNLPGSEKAGSVGIPTPGSTIRISEQGEVLAKGIGVFSGYKRPEHNAEAFVDGFFRTGDLGTLDDSGRLTLKGRLKDVIVTSGGKTVTPAQWENIVENDPLVAHAIAVGEGKPFLSSLIVVEPEVLANWAAEQGEQEIVDIVRAQSNKIIELDNQRLRDAISRTINRANTQFSRSEQIRKFIIVIADLSVSGGNITATMKLKRQVLLGKVSAIVERLYTEPYTGGTR
ncbi:AMP-dependent synthetase/ligase [Populibacterium corticicola]|uniref:AMP-dependent synthetase/ligase n=1 Tax=Populibacterium corticicola TaxID=1812826 RepID=A0ABW5XG19_9MICO